VAAPFRAERQVRRRCRVGREGHLPRRRHRLLAAGRRFSPAERPGQRWNGCADSLALTGR
jgi:hypothetical protein